MNIATWDIKTMAVNGSDTYKIFEKLLKSPKNGDLLVHAITVGLLH